MAWKDMAYLLKGLEMIGNLTDTGMNIYDRVQGKRDENFMADFQNQIKGEAKSLEDFQRLDQENLGNRLLGLRNDTQRGKARSWYEEYRDKQLGKLAQNDILDQFATAPSDRFSAEQTITNIAARYNLPMDQAKALYSNAMTGTADNNAAKRFAADRASNIANTSLTPEQILLREAMAGQSNPGVSAADMDSGQKRTLETLALLGKDPEQTNLGGATVITNRNRLNTPTNVTEVSIGDKEHSPYSAYGLAGGGNPKQQQYLNEGAREVGNAFYAMAKQLGVDLDAIDAALTDTNGNYNPAKMLSQFPPELQQAYNHAIAGMTNGVLANQPYTTAAQDAAAAALAAYQKRYSRGGGGGKERRSLDEIMR